MFYVKLIMVKIKMARKKKFKLKKKFRRLLLYIVILVIITMFGINRYNVYKYHQTNEYKLLEVGYDEKTVEILLDKLNDKQQGKLIETEKIDYILDIVNEKYFLQKNFEKYLEYYKENSKYSFSDIIAVVNVGADKEWYEETQETDITKGYSILANKFNLLPEEFDAGVIKEFSATYAYGKVSAEETTYHAFIEMAKAAKEDGITLILTSGYRTREKQETLYNDMLKSRGQTYADDYAARPGASEHETGLALDILTYNGTTDTFETTETYAWLIAHCHEYGFILRYPKDKEHITGYKPESWHYRYVGVELAQKIKDEGITYDEYYAYYLDK